MPFFVIDDRCGWNTPNLAVRSVLPAALTLPILIERRLRRMAEA
ncbi:MAG TPA: hypothetical protein PLE48_04110 [Thiobacillus sp.]|nr:hypothetical protein [Thiobacillus sp.]HQT69593.1 hypothetical protein [Thiobacillus sp.]